MARDSIVTVDENNRLQLPPEVKDWFPPGARFVLDKEGEVVTLRRLGGLAAHLAAVEAAGQEGEMSWEEIDAEIQAVRHEKAAADK